LLKAAKKVWLDEPASLGKETKIHRFHHVSTDEVYGTLLPDDAAFTEETAYAPNSPYSASKAASDHLVRAYCHTYGLNVTTSNCSNNYGPYHFPENWLYVEDHAYGIDLVLTKGCVGENYNIGGNNEWANINIVKEVCALLEAKFSSTPSLAKQFPKATAAIAGNTESLISYVQDRPGHDRRYAIDATKTQKELGYEPRESFKTGIEKTINWYLENEDWWQAVMDGSYKNWIDEQYN